jgi:D-galacturonate reductase
MNSHRPNVLVIGKGEYVTGLLRDGTISTDKGHGVVTLVLADLRRRGLIGPKIGLCGTTGRGWTEIREHLRRNIERFKSLSADFDTFPVDTCEWDGKAYMNAMDQFRQGDIAMVYTPDRTHFSVAREAIKRGMHVMIAKPAVISLEEHRQLADEAKRNKVLACVENHKRYDPIYAHFKQTVGELGEFSYFSSYMSQPACQARHYQSRGASSTDVSFYLNSHHVDFHAWLMGNRSIPLTITAHGSRGVLEQRYGFNTPDTIILLAKWQDQQTGAVGHGSYTASWIAQPSDVFTQQRWFYLGSTGEASADQAHRGYRFLSDSQLCSPNPLYMTGLQSNQGIFTGQSGYGYQVFEHFVEAVGEIRNGQSTAEDFDDRLATLRSTMNVTAILDAGRQSLMSNGMPFKICHVGLEPQTIEPSR